MVKLALLALQVNFLTLEQNHVLTVKINKNIFQITMNANNFTKNPIMIQVKTGLHKMAIANLLTTNSDNLRLKVFQCNNVPLINHSPLKI